MTAPASEVATQVVEVEFKGNRRAFFTWNGEVPPAARAAVIVQVERGEDFGRIYSTGELAARRKAGTTHGKASPADADLPAVVRLATKQEIDTAVRLRADEDAVRKAAIELVRQQKLDMKVSDTEWQWDRRRLTCYFTADERVDFRQLVRALERRFSTRVHMWHIGVRDEARRLDGVGRCGRQFCSSSWLPELRPVKSSSAKDQHLSTLNPSQISGTCGRLMCCLRHEHEFYVQARKRFPKEGKIITTSLGEEKVVSNNIFRDEVTLRTPDGEHRTITLVELRQELGEGVLPPDEAPAAPGELVALKRPVAKDAPAVAPVAAVEAAAEPGHEADATEEASTPPDSADATEEASTPPDSADASAESGAATPRRTRGRRRRGRRGGRRSRANNDPAAPPEPSDPTT